MTKIIDIRTKKSTEFVDITGKIKDIVKSAGAREGMALVFTKHTTCAIAINENESRLVSDFDNMLEKLIPKDGAYGHDGVDSNANAHIRSMIIGPSETIPIIDGTLALGTWQSIFLGEFDGPRDRNVYVQVLKEE